MRPAGREGAGQCGAEREGEWKDKDARRSRAAPLLLPLSSFTPLN